MGDGGLVVEFAFEGFGFLAAEGVLKFFGEGFAGGAAAAYYVDFGVACVVEFAFDGDHSGSPVRDGGCGWF